MDNILEIRCRKIRIENEYWKKIDREIYNKKIFYLNHDLDKKNISKYNIYHDDLISNGIGFLIKENMRYYVITCYHIIKNCYEITTKINKTQVKLNLVESFQEFDIAILEINA